MKDVECWEKCEYANPKSEIISAYLMKKKEIKRLRKKLFNILSEYEIGNYDNNIHQFYIDVYNVHNELMELAE